MFLLHKRFYYEYPLSGGLMDYVLIYSDTKDTFEDILIKIYNDFIENNLKDLLTKNDY